MHTPSEGPFRRILVGWDAKDISTRAFAVAAQLAHACHAELLAVSIARIPDHAESLEEREASRVAAERFYHDRLGTLHKAAERAGVTFHYAVVPSMHRPEAIIAYARDHACDLIVLGSRHGGGGGFCRLLSGMLGEAVARGSSCPVLLIPGPSGEE
jgi:nucleotide-binding universal stress UspA family protein